MERRPLPLNHSGAGAFGLKIHSRLQWEVPSVLDSSHPSPLNPIQLGRHLKQGETRILFGCSAACDNCYGFHEVYSSSFGNPTVK